MTDPAAIARAEERAAIVAWLRDRAREAMPGPTSAAMAQVITAYAKCIDQGSHLLNAAGGGS